MIKRTLILTAILFAMCNNLQAQFQADLTRTDVIKLIAIATKPLDLTGVNLTGVDLSKLNLSGANLTRASLFQTSFIGTDLTGANFTGANNMNENYFRNAIMTGVKGYVVKP